MFESISRGWALTKTSWRVLKLDKEILALPLISFVVLVGVVVSFLLPLRFGLGAVPALALLFGAWVAAYFVIFWFNAAVIEMATIRFNGGDPVLKDGLRKAWSKSGRILQWAVVAATVGLILKVLDMAARQIDNPVTEIIARIAISIAGAAWSIATYFVMPILIYQDIGPGQAIKSSVGTWKRTWGEGFTATFSTGIIFFLLGLVGLVPLFLFPSFTTLVVVGVYWVLLGAVNTAIDGIIVAALYKYAVDGRLPEAFANDVQQRPVAPVRYA